jgi:hypothetical protein
LIKEDPDHFTHTVTLSIQLLEDAKPGSYAYVPRTFEFRDCALLFTNLDLDGKRNVSGDIAAATCERANESVNAALFNISDREELVDYFCFHFELIPPAGSVVIVAKQFQLT